MFSEGDEGAITDLFQSHDRTDDFSEGPPDPSHVSGQLARRRSTSRSEQGAETLLYVLTAVETARNPRPSNLPDTPIGNEA